MTLVTRMMSRTMVILSGPTSPWRTTVSVMGVPGLPRMIFTASSRFMPFTDVSSSRTTRSPASMPARAAGVSSIGAMTRTIPVLHADLHPEAAELSGGPGLECRVVVGNQIGGVRVESRQHALDGILEQRLVVDGFDVVVLYLDEDLGEDAQILDRQSAAVLLRQHPLPEAEQDCQTCSCSEEHEDAKGRFHVHLPGGAGTEARRLGTKRADFIDFSEGRTHRTGEKEHTSGGQSLTSIASCSPRTVSCYGPRPKSKAWMTSSGLDWAGRRGPWSPTDGVRVRKRVLQPTSGGCSASVKWPCLLSQGRFMPADPLLPARRHAVSDGFPLARE